MRYYALATDYDGTLAHHGRVDDATLAALERLRDSGRRLIMVTGRQLEDLMAVFPQYALFDRIVAENGGLLYCPASRQEKALGEAPPPALIAQLKERGVEPVAVGRVIVATWTPHEKAVLDAIRDLGLEWHVIFNKGAVMVLPSGVNKATGLEAALDDLGLSVHNVVGVGDAENDHAFLKTCECAVAVENALPALKARADLVTREARGEGVSELIEMVLADDLARLDGRLGARTITIGQRGGGEEVRLAPGRESVLVAGASGVGKSTFTTSVLERLSEQCYQFCIIDPEGDYEEFESAVALGDARHTPTVEEVLALLQKPEENAVVNMIGIALDDRPAFFEGLFLRLKEMRARTGRPHWIVIDEAHHLMPPAWAPAKLVLPKELWGTVMITTKPEHVSPAVLTAADVVIAIGKGAEEALHNYARCVSLPLPAIGDGQVERGEGLFWRRRAGEAPLWFRSAPSKAERRRHIRKYAEGQMDEDRNFFFRGPEGKLNLRAQNLNIFLQMAEGVDDETWLFHLRRGDVARWFREAVKDAAMAEEAEAIARDAALGPRESRGRIRAIVERRYTAAA